MESKRKENATNSGVESIVLSSPSCCMICLGSILTSDCHTVGDDDIDNDLLQRFANFCVHYLKVDSTLVELIKAGNEIGNQEESVKAVKTFCSRCERIVRDTLKIFAEWSNLRTKLVGEVNKIGIIIGKSSSGSLGIDTGITSFREQLEDKCLGKFQLLQPSIQRVSTNPRHSSRKSKRIPIISYSSDSDEDIKSTGSDAEYILPDDSAEDNNLTAVQENRRTVSTLSTRKRKIIIECESESSDSDFELNTETRRSKRTRIKNKTTKGNSRPQFTYRCSECQITIKRKADFFQHNLTVHEGLDINKLLECSVCHKKQPNIIDLQKHLKDKHEKSSQKNTFCFKCTEVFINEQQRDLHIRLDHSTCPHIMCEVPECDQKYLSVKDYNEHLKCHSCSSDNTIYCCEDCGRGFLEKNRCELHKLYHLPKDDLGFYVCPIQTCDKNNKYKHVSKLINHFNTQHLSVQDQLELHRCKQCKISPFFMCRKELSVHLQSHTKEVQCKHCNKLFSGQTKLRVHQFNKHPGKFNGNFIASQRQVGLNLEEDFPTNNKVKDNDESNLYRTCPYCFKNYSTFYELEKHKFQDHQINVFTKPVQIQCEICGITISKAMLSRHMICHQEPQIPCPYEPCTKKFRREENLIMHVKKVHDRKECDREFVCETCGKRYLTKGYLNRHVKEQHIKPFSCHLCPKSFSTLVRVNEHLRASHTNEKFQCKWCPNQYGWLLKLKVHVKKKHPEEAHLLSSIYNYSMKPKTIQYSVH